MTFGFLSVISYQAVRVEPVCHVSLNHKPGEEKKPSHSTVAATFFEGNLLE